MAAAIEDRTADFEASSVIPPLSQRQYEILQAMFQLRAVDASRRQNTAEIARKAEGKQAHTDNFKKPMAALKKLGYIATKVGRGGGCWLTPEGVGVARLLG
jgi:DNA-binding IscR family transcriptional regulator